LPVFLGLRSKKMQRVNEFSFYDLAVRIHTLTEIPDSVKLSEIWLDWWQARDALDLILTLRPLSVSRGAAHKLVQAITAHVPKMWSEMSAVLATDLTTEAPLQPWQIYPIKEAAKEFETVLAAECQVLDTYFISKKGVYSTADLVEHAHHHFSDAIRNELPEQTKADFDQAGKCIAFDLPTAAAFHLLRGTESVLRKYYDRVVPGEKRAAPKMRNWGAYIKLLEQHGAESQVTSLLIHLKDAYRNPVLHPEENYTDERIQVLFGVCISAIAIMIGDLKKFAPKTPNLPFPEGYATEFGRLVAAGITPLLAAAPEEDPTPDGEIEPIPEEAPSDSEGPIKA
jgi:hypothetical protein